MKDRLVRLAFPGLYDLAAHIGVRFELPHDNPLTMRQLILAKLTMLIEVHEKIAHEPLG